jgi:hypothetical protein
MAEQDRPDSYTQSLAEFGSNAVAVIDGVSGALESLAAGYRYLDRYPPGGDTGAAGDGGGTAGPQPEDLVRRETAVQSDEHDALAPVRRALAALRNFTTEVYIRGGGA